MSFSNMPDEKLTALAEWMETSLTEIRDVQDAREAAKRREEDLRERTVRVVVETVKDGGAIATSRYGRYGIHDPYPEYKTREQVLREALRAWNIGGAEIHLVGGTLATTTFDVILRKKNSEVDN